MCCGEGNLQKGCRSLTKQVRAEPDPLAMPQASQIRSNLGLEATLLPLLEMHWERGCCCGLSDTAQHVAKKWFSAQVSGQQGEQKCLGLQGLLQRDCKVTCQNFFISSRS